MKKRLFAAALCLALIVCLLPRTVRAAEPIILGVGPDANGRYKTGKVYVPRNTVVHLVADIYDAVPAASLYQIWYLHSTGSETMEDEARVVDKTKDLGEYRYFCMVDGARSSNTLTIEFFHFGVTNIVQPPQN